MSNTVKMPAFTCHLKHRVSARKGIKTLCLVGSLLAIGLVVGGCGKKGPLYLPDPVKQSQDDQATQTPSKTSEQETQ
ncbi:lipoprotein [Thiomicrorhabdus sp. ZW0627]|uniref:LPS translocon maturation chaperone LptM n=1 Tax=Thiomicrorhabdus sp. ZW0627 TaxID=3039774 RepID=UPI00243644B6|nr:lipoprotein [Thiomicrorhabdus sp. ZW0627]MDG6773797.1 lipoprotein [Thiomicrorhabdus sp. ZW0627]